MNVFLELGPGVTAENVSRLDVQKLTDICKGLRSSQIGAEMLVSEERLERLELLCDVEGRGTRGWMSWFAELWVCTFLDASLDL